jgi:hypothetical protein
VKAPLLLLGALALLLAAGCGGGGGGKKSTSPADMTSKDVCGRLDLAMLHDLTDDGWKRALPEKGYVGCEVQITQDAPGRIYVTVGAEAAKPTPDRELAREFFNQETHYAGFRPVAGVGDAARFRAQDEELVVLDDAVTYKVQVLSDRLHDQGTLKPALAIYKLVRNGD